MLKGYDSYNTLLLPPRLAGEKLPPEVYEYFKEMQQSKEEQMKVKHLENLAQENGENSTWRALHSSLGFCELPPLGVKSVIEHLPGARQVLDTFVFYF